MDLRGFSHGKLFVSGGLEEEEILRLNPVADAYGVGTSISNAPVMNFAMDIVEVDGVPLAKRGKMSGRKAVYRCAGCGAELFSAATKYDSGSGWPSFYQPADSGAVEMETDRSLGMSRTEVMCASCGGDLGPAFPGGPRPTGPRHLV